LSSLLSCVAFVLLFSLPCLLVFVLLSLFIVSRLNCTSSTCLVVVFVLYCHLGFFHRDIKPENILATRITPDEPIPRLKIAGLVDRTLPCLVWSLSGLVWSGLVVSCFVSVMGTCLLSFVLSRCVVVRLT
jgi:serine/threonine protein kinase